MKSWVVFEFENFARLTRLAFVLLVDRWVHTKISGAKSWPGRQHGHLEQLLLEVLGLTLCYSACHVTALLLANMACFVKTAI